MTPVAKEIVYEFVKQMWWTGNNDLMEYKVWAIGHDLVHKSVRISVGRVYELIHQKMCID